MLKLRVPIEVSKARYEICENCKFFQKNTGTCGPPVVGKNLTTSELIDAGLLVSFKKKKVRLCGCIMKAKTLFHFAKCPVGKWDMLNMTDRDYVQLRSLIEMLLVKGKADNSQVRELFGFKSKMVGRNISPQYCSACVKEVLEELRHTLRANNIEHQMEESITKILTDVQDILEEKIKDSEEPTEPTE